MRIILFSIMSFLLLSCGRNSKMKLEEPGKAVKDSVHDTNHFEGYTPDHPINFPHSKHAGIRGIDCKYCHNSVDDKVATSPSPQICLDCHQSTKGNELLENYPGKNGIVWKKVENLDDSVSFNTNQKIIYCTYLVNGRSLPKDTSKLDGYECAKCHY